MSNGFLLRGMWFFKLPDPFRLTPYYPLDAQSITEMLQISYKSALRICQSERPLKQHELIYLQMMIFGLIPDPLFLRHKWFFRDGLLLSHNNTLELDISDLASYALLRQNQYLLISELERARQKITELDAQLHPKPTNIIKFSDYFNKD